MLQPVRVLAIAAVGGTAAGLDESGAPGGLVERAQGRRRMEGAGPHFQVIGLQNHAALRRPELLEAQDDVLETFRLVGHRDYPLKRAAHLTRAVEERSSGLTPRREMD